jgi:hypothetical protein
MRWRCVERRVIYDEPSAMRDRFQWGRLLTFVTGLVNQELLLRNKYLAAHNRILRAAFEEKAAEIIGLYMEPPQHAAVFCVDEKTAIQALDRLDPVLPLSPGRAEKHGFEYYRHGTLSLYAALDVKTGKVHGKTASRQKEQQNGTHVKTIFALQRSRLLPSSVSEFVHDAGNRPPDCKIGRLHSNSQSHALG